MGEREAFEAQFEHGHRCFEPDPTRKTGAGYLTTPANQPCDIDWHERLVTYEEYQRLQEALTYISSPTMTLPAGADAAEFALDGATEDGARRALHTCITMARSALRSTPQNGRPS